MATRRLDHAVVYDDDAIVGTLCKLALLNARAHVAVHQVMDEPAFIATGADNDEACRLISYHHVRALVVVGSDFWVGIVTAEDAAAAAASVGAATSRSRTSHRDG